MPSANNVQPKMSPVEIVEQKPGLAQITASGRFGLSVSVRASVQLVQLKIKIAVYVAKPAEHAATCVDGVLGRIARVRGFVKRGTRKPRIVENADNVPGIVPGCVSGEIGPCVAVRVFVSHAQKTTLVAGIVGLKPEPA